MTAPQQQQEYSEGLEDVVVGPSAICTVDGLTPQLIYRGYDINDLAVHATFEEVIYLLWHGDLPTRAQLDQLTTELGANREIPGPVLEQMRGFPRKVHPLDILRTAISAAALYDPDVEDNSPDANMRKAIRLMGLTASVVATWHRIRTDQPVVAPRSDLSLAANFLYMLFGEQPNPLYTRAMDVALILHADHELNASTFAARVIAATLSDMHAAMTGAIGALKGPLHGGANEDVIDMLLEIGEPSRAEAWIKNRLDEREKLSADQRRSAKARIPGFGHRVYRVNDPRAQHLRRMSREIGEQRGNTRWAEIQEIIRENVQSRLKLPVNVDYYSATVYYSMGIPTDIYTSIFAVSRMSGWTAHVMEQYSHNRLIRPRALYTGPKDRTWVPLEQRG